ncbi:MAG: hypothetical protein NVSMB56_09390 [Pyrinomonadaceae bacterium]
MSIKNDQTIQTLNVAQNFDSNEAEQDLSQPKINLEEEQTKNESENFDSQIAPSTPSENILIDGGSGNGNHHTALQGTGGTALSAGDDQRHGVIDSGSESRPRRKGTSKPRIKKSTEPLNKPTKPPTSKPRIKKSTESLRKVKTTGT